MLGQNEDGTNPAFVNDSLNGIVPECIDSDGPGTNINNPTFNKSIVQIGDVIVFNNEHPNNSSVPDVIDKIHKLNAQVIIANKEGAKWSKTINWRILISVTLGVVVSTGIILGIFLWSGNPSESPTRYDEQSWYTNGTLRIITRKDWGALKSTAQIRLLSVNPPNLVIISHTAGASCDSLAECSQRVRDIQAFHINLDDMGNEIAYNFLVGGDGNVYIGRGWSLEGAHTRSYNNRSLGICFLGNFVNVVPPEGQVKGVFDLIQLAYDKGKISPDYKLYGHQQLIATLSPGEKVMEIIKKWPHWAKDR